MLFMLTCFSACLFSASNSLFLHETAVANCLKTNSVQFLSYHRSRRAAPSLHVMEGEGFSLLQSKSTNSEVKLKKTNCPSFSWRELQVSAMKPLQPFSTVLCKGTPPVTRPEDQTASLVLVSLQNGTFGFSHSPSLF